MVQWGFERHRSQTQLNSGQPELCLLVSSKHLWCQKNILTDTGLQRNKPFWAPCAFLCPSSPSPSLWDTSLSFIFPLNSQFPLCDLYCISDGALFQGSKETIIVASRTLSKHSEHTKPMWEEIVFVWVLTVLLWALHNEFVKVWPAQSYLSLTWISDNQRTWVWWRKTTEKAVLTIKSIDSSSAVCHHVAAVTLALTSISSLPEFITLQPDCLSLSSWGSYNASQQHRNSAPLHRCTASLAPYICISVLGDSCRSTSEILPIW